MIFSEESKEAFTIHMDKLLDSYKRIIVVNLLDAEGKEGPLGEEYANIVSRRGVQLFSGAWGMVWDVCIVCYKCYDM